MEADGYRTPSLWLSDGWAFAQREGLEAPGYWELRGGAWHQMTLHGLRKVEESRPVTHVSYYEADAFARWAGHRLPTEFEWEIASRGQPGATPLDLSNLLPGPHRPKGVSRLFGGVWEWTQSAYLPYPGYRPATGALGEYNGKFMCNQMVLRGGSLRPADIISARPTAISSILISAGSSWACGLRETYDGRNRSVSRDPG